MRALSAIGNFVSNDGIDRVTPTNLPNASMGEVTYTGTYVTQFEVGGGDFGHLAGDASLDVDFTSDDVDGTISGGGTP